MPPQDARAFDAEDLLREHGPHRRELDEMLRPAVGIRAGVDEHGRPAPGGNDDADRGSLDAGQATNVEQ